MSATTSSQVLSPQAPVHARVSARRRLGSMCTAGALLLLSPVSQAQFAVQPLQPAAPAAVPAAPAPKPEAPATKPVANKAAPKGTDGAKGPEKAGEKAKDRGKEGAKADDAGKPASKLPKAVTPKPLPLAKMGPTRSNAEIFGLTAPSTVLLIAAQDNRWRSTLGVIVTPQGTVVTDSRLLSGVEKGTVQGFLYDPSLASDEDPLMFLRAHKDQAQKLNVVRVDPEHHLLMLALPALPPKKTYPFLDLQDTAGVNPGLDVIALRTRGAQTLALSTGSIAIKRRDVIEIEPALSVESAGAPLVSQSGRLLGICTYADKSLNASGQARPVEIIRDLLAGKVGTEPTAQAAPSAPENPIESRNSVEAVRIALGLAYAQRLDRQPALRLHSEFIAAMAARGRLVVQDVDSVEALNAIIKSTTKGFDGKSKAVADLFPLLVTEKSGSVWMKAGTSYRLVPASGGGVAAIDDISGTLYATDTRREVMFLDETPAGKSWRMTGLNNVTQLRASGGQLYAILADGRLIVADRDGKNSRQLFPRTLKPGSSIEVSQGVLYVINEGSVFRYRNKKWDAKLQPIAFSIQKLVVRGETWYGLDAAGRVFSSASQSYIDRDGNIIGLWGLGPNLLVLTRDHNRFFHDPKENTWGAWARW